MPFTYKQQTCHPSLTQNKIQRNRRDECQLIRVEKKLTNFVWFDILYSFATLVNNLESPWRQNINEDNQYNQSLFYYPKIGKLSVSLSRIWYLPSKWIKPCFQSSEMLDKIITTYSYDIFCVCIICRKYPVFLVLFLALISGCRKSLRIKVGHTQKHYVRLKSIQFPLIRTF